MTNMEIFFIDKTCMNRGKIPQQFWDCQNAVKEISNIFKFIPVKTITKGCTYLQLETFLSIYVADSLIYSWEIRPSLAAYSTESWIINDTRRGRKDGKGKTHKRWKKAQTTGKLKRGSKETRKGGKERMNYSECENMPFNMIKRG